MHPLLKCCRAKAIQTSEKHFVAGLIVLSSPLILVLSPSILNVTRLLPQQAQAPSLLLPSTSSSSEAPPESTPLALLGPKSKVGYGTYNFNHNPRILSMLYCLQKNPAAHKSLGGLPTLCQNGWYILALPFLIPTILMLPFGNPK